MKYVSFSRWTIILLVLGVRLLYILPHGNEIILPERDQLIYKMLALNIMQGNGMILSEHPYRIRPELPEMKKHILQKWKHQQAIYGINRFGTPTSMWEPGYPLFLAAVFKLFGTSPLAVKILQVFMDGISCLVLMSIVRQLHTDISAKIAGLCFAFYPFFIYYTAILMAESLLTLELILLLYFLIKAYYSNRGTMWMMAGLCMGSAMLTRSSVLGLIPVFILLALLQKTSLKQKTVTLTSFMVAFLIVVIPWGIRNANVHGTFFIMATRGGLNLWWRNNPFYFEDELNTVGITIPSSIRNSIRRSDLLDWPDFTIESEPDRDAVMKKRMITFLYHNPKLFAWLCMNRFFWITGVSGGTVRGTFYTVAALSSYGTLAILALCGIYGFLRNKRWIALLPASIIVYFIFFYTLTHEGIRYRIPADTMIIIFASVPLGIIVQSWIQKLNGTIQAN